MSTEQVLKSESLSQLFTALSAAQSKIKSATKDSTNPHFKSSYADLASVWEACRDPLTENGLCIVQLPTVSDGRVNVLTILGHKSGEFIGCNLSLKPMRDDPQGDGSAITYARRYGLSAVAGIAPDDDDDGNEASRRQPQNGYNAEPKRDRPPFSPQPQPVGAPKQITLDANGKLSIDGKQMPEKCVSAEFIEFERSCREEFLNGKPQDKAKKTLDAIKEHVLGSSLAIEMHMNTWDHVRDCKSSDFFEAQLATLRDRAMQKQQQSVGAA